MANDNCTPSYTNDERPPYFELADQVIPNILALSDILSDCNSNVSNESKDWLAHKIYISACDARDLIEKWRLETHGAPKAPADEEVPLQGLNDAIQNLYSQLDTIDSDEKLTKLHGVGREQIEMLTTLAQTLGGQLERVNRFEQAH